MKNVRRQHLNDKYDSSLKDFIHSTQKGENNNREEFGELPTIQCSRGNH